MIHNVSFNKPPTALSSLIESFTSKPRPQTSKICIASSHNIIYIHRSLVQAMDSIYTPLFSVTATRLLNIEPSATKASPLVCTFHQTDIRQATGYAAYSAVSYVWGDEYLTQEITSQGKPATIRQNLFDFLIQARENGWTKYVWIHALCINQNDIPKRNQQVAMMGEIYLSASNVLIWLGTMDEDEISTLRSVEILECAPRRNGSHFGPRFDAKKLWSNLRLKALYGILGREYWSRKWIIQEITLASENASIVCGNGQLRLRTLLRFCEYLTPEALDELKIKRPVYFHNIFNYFVEKERLKTGYR